jgi:peptidoglycan/xylan/chitin deacetylase (PgdA/CDA1 family)
VAAAGAVAAYWSPAAAPFAPAVARAFGIRTTIAAARGVLLSFDDGPHLHGTPAVLFELERLRAQAVFFVSGSRLVDTVLSSARSWTRVTKSVSTGTSIRRAVN